MQGFVAVFKHHLKLDPLPQLNQRDRAVVVERAIGWMKRGCIDGENKECIPKQKTDTPPPPHKI